MNVWIRRTLQTGLLVAGMVTLAATPAHAGAAALTSVPTPIAVNSAGTIQHTPATGSVVIGKPSRKKLRLVTSGSESGPSLGAGPAGDDDQTLAADGAGWQVATADGAGWQTATRDGAGWQVATTDGAGWQVATTDGAGWQTATRDGAGWQVATTDGAGWQTATRDGAGWQVATTDGAGWQAYAA